MPMANDAVTPIFLRLDIWSRQTIGSGSNTTPKSIPMLNPADAYSIFRTFPQVPGMERFQL